MSRPLSNRRPGWRSGVCGQRRGTGLVRCACQPLLFPGTSGVRPRSLRPGGV